MGLQINVLVGLKVNIIRSESGIQGRCADLRSACPCARNAASGDDFKNVRINQPGTRRTIDGTACDDSGVSDAEHGTRSLNKTTIPAIGRTRIQRAAHVDRASLHVGHQADLALLAGGEGLSADHTRVVDGGAGKFVHSLRGEVNQAAVGLNGAPVLHQGIDSALLDLQLDRAAQIQRHVAAGTQQHVATGGGQIAVIGDLGCDQRNRATLASFAYS